MSGTSDVTTAMVDPIIELSGINCLAVKAAELDEQGIDTTAEPTATVMVGRPFEILEEKTKKKEQAKRAKALAKRKAAKEAAKPQSSRRHQKRVAASKGKYGLPRNAKKYSVAELDAIVREVATEEGCTKAEIREMIYIFHRESRDNRAVGGSRDHFCGMWQMRYTMCVGNPWWDPYWQTKRAIKYMRGHRYQGYGKGIHAAYLHKRAKGWY